MLAMTIIEKRGGFLHEHRPDIIPQGYMTDEELAMWGAFYERRAAESKKA